MKTTEEELKNEILDKFNWIFQSQREQMDIIQFKKVIDLSFKAGKQKAHDEELEFLEKIENYCDEMKFNVGVSILDDFNKMIKERIKTLEQK